MVDKNLYGDVLRSFTDGHGVDIASQRADWLDNKACEYIQTLILDGINVNAIDLGCGLGAQVFRMIKAGAKVATGVDSHPFTNSERQAISENFDVNIDRKAVFLCADMVKWLALSDKNYCDLLICQRTIHYLPSAEAVKVLVGIKKLLTSSGRLYISASGLLSELSDDYEHKTYPVTKRFCVLGNEMALKHKIHKPVCLYTHQEFVALLSVAGFNVLEYQVSEFGNIKIIAEKK